ncbi:chaperone protein dnaJ 72-like [Salvia miltiorrhiza]|uniref:chaperone protein dnaJ 72-like n=1 Tax=Salvia miltiorrhiza TaxID=226208 RepID=UPI0025AD7035|nr:chaperone protein dnaJ 72-like [Salvia miltiorrhiza]
MDHYKILGIHKSASKEEIKQAFRKLAMEFHPDKHSQSPKSLKDSATVKFKQLSEAYETLIDDRKRADYNLRRNTYGNGPHQNQNNRYNYHYGGDGGGGGGYGYRDPYANRYSGSARRGGGGGGFVRFEMGLRYLTTKSFLLNATLISILLGGMFIIDASGKALWKMHNTGKSFEETMESIEKAKASKDSSE